MHTARFELVLSESERPQTHDIDRAATRIDQSKTQFIFYHQFLFDSIYSLILQDKDCQNLTKVSTG
jgi:hypothetical protein